MSRCGPAPAGPRSTAAGGPDPAPAGRLPRGVRACPGARPPRPRGRGPAGPHDHRLRHARAAAPVTSAAARRPLAGGHRHPGLRARASTLGQQPAFRTEYDASWPPPAARRPPPGPDRRPGGPPAPDARPRRPGDHAPVGPAHPVGHRGRHAQPGGDGGEAVPGDRPPGAGRSGHGRARPGGPPRGGGAPGYGPTALRRLFLFSRAGTIYGGPNQAQRNVIGERALGLPRGPRWPTPTSPRNGPCACADPCRP